MMAVRVKNDVGAGKVMSVRVNDVGAGKMMSMRVKNDIGAGLKRCLCD